jgi:hypothetical protein
MISNKDTPEISAIVESKASGWSRAHSTQSGVWADAFSNRSVRSTWLRFSQNKKHRKQSNCKKALNRDRTCADQKDTADEAEVDVVSEC